MSALESGAFDVAGPSLGNISVLAITTSASAATDLGALSPGRWVSMRCSSRWYVTFDGDSTITDPDETTASGNGRTWEVAADEVLQFRVTKATRYFKAKGTASANLRYYFSNNPGGSSRFY